MHAWENWQIVKTWLVATSTINFMPSGNGGIFFWRAFLVLLGMFFLLRKIIHNHFFSPLTLKENVVLLADKWVPTFHVWLLAFLWHSTFPKLYHRAILLLTSPLWQSSACLPVLPVWKKHTPNWWCVSYWQHSSRTSSSTYNRNIAEERPLPSNGKMCVYTRHSFTFLLYLADGLNNDRNNC